MQSFAIWVISREIEIHKGGISGIERFSLANLAMALSYDPLSTRIFSPYNLRQPAAMNIASSAINTSLFDHYVTHVFRSFG